MQPQSEKSKKSYHKPQLSVYRDVKTFTLSVGNGVATDGLGQQNQNKTA